MRRAYRRRSVIASRLKAFSSFSDAFSLSSGMKNGWKSLSGSWSSNSGNVTSSTDAATYPISYVKMSKPDITASANVSSGTGISFWISNSGSWWASAYVQKTYNYSCNPYSCNCGSCPSYAYGANCSACGSTPTYGYVTVCSGETCTTTSYNCNPYSCYVCEVYGSGGRCLQGYYDTCYNTCTSTSCTPNCSDVYQQTGSTCNSCTYYAGQETCNCGTCYQTCSANGHFLSLIKSESGVVSSATSDVSLGQAAAAIWVQTSGNSITVKAYSDINRSNQIGTTISYTATSPSRTGLAGIIKAPSNNQATSISSLNISTN